MRALLAPDPGNRFLREFLLFQQRVARAGAFNSLSQRLLELVSPGVPGFHQGCEMWEFSLVGWAQRNTAPRVIKEAPAERAAPACTIAGSSYT